MSNREQFDTARLNAISITEVARRLGEKVRRVGVNHVTHCPWHDDHHPSLSLVEGTGKNYCHCFSCDKGGDVVGYVMQHEHWTFQEACQWLSATFGISSLTMVCDVPKPKQRQAEQPVEPVFTYIPMAMVDELESTGGSLCQCLMRMFQPEAVEWLAEEYRLGCYSLFEMDDWTVFPSIDCLGRVCNLKVQHYDTDMLSARFAHSDQTTRWLGKLWIGEGRLPKDAELRSDCLFGEHLLSRYPQSVVALVESPKNALFGALEYPHLMWIATGNKSNLKRQSLLPLRGRDVIVIPDRDAVDEWRSKIGTMTDLANFTVSDFCQRMAPANQPKFDIADYISLQHPPAF